MALLLPIKAPPKRIRMKNNNYARLTDIFEISRQEIKDLEETLVSVLGGEVDTNIFYNVSLSWKAQQKMWVDGNGIKQTENDVNRDVDVNQLLIFLC